MVSPSEMISILTGHFRVASATPVSHGCSRDVHTCTSTQRQSFVASARRCRLDYFDSPYARDQVFSGAFAISAGARVAIPRVDSISSKIALTVIVVRIRSTEYLLEDTYFSAEYIANLRERDR